MTVTESLSLLVLARKQVKDLLARRDMSIKVERSYTICEFLYNKGGHTDDPGSVERSVE